MTPSRSPATDSTSPTPPRAGSGDALGAGAALDRAIGDLVTTLRESGMPSARNLLVTVFGDAIAPSGSAVPVQALIRLLEPVGVNERLVRTSLTRLVRERMLDNERVGRRSIYSIAPSARTVFERADTRIYHHHEPEWDGRWTLAVVDPNASTAASRTTLRRELAWLGLGTVAPNVLASPNVEPEQVTATLARIGGDHQVLVTRGTAADGAMTMSDEEIARRCAPMNELSERYAEIVEWFAPVADAVASAADPTPEQCWTIRLLLIATFRRVALADPSLPERLLPPSWHGPATRALAGSLYARVFSPAETWLADVCSDPITAWAPASGPGERFRERRSG